MTVEFVKMGGTLEYEEKKPFLRNGASPKDHLPTVNPAITKAPSSVFTISLIGSWYFSNIGVLLLNKYLLSNYGFKFPIFLTMCHMSACALFSYVAIAWMKVVPMQAIRSRSQFIKIAALSVIFCTSVVSGNISLRFLPVSFNQAIGATTPFFTAIFAYAMTFRREAWLTYATLVPVVVGVVIASGVRFSTYSIFISFRESYHLALFLFPSFLSLVHSLWNSWFSILIHHNCLSHPSCLILGLSLSSLS